MSRDLIREYEALEGAIEASAAAETWVLARWLAENVPVQKPVPGGRTTVPEDGGTTLAVLAARGYRSERTLQKLRQVAIAFGEPVGTTTRNGREVPISVKAHEVALSQAGGDVDEARRALIENGGRLRDQMPSLDLNAARRALRDRPGDVLAGLAPEAVEQVEFEARRRLREARRSVGNLPDAEPVDGEPTRARVRPDELAVHCLGVDESVRHLHAAVQKCEPGEIPVELVLHTVDQAQMRLAAIKAHILGGSVADDVAAFLAGQGE